MPKAGVHGSSPAGCGLFTFAMPKARVHGSSPAGCRLFTLAMPKAGVQGSIPPGGAFYLSIAMPKASPEPNMRHETVRAPNDVSIAMLFHRNGKS